MEHCSSRYASYIDRLLIGDLSRRKMNRLREHLPSCEGCQGRYNRAVMASRLLEGGPAALDLPAQRELDWLEPVVLERARLVPDSAPARRSVLLRIAAPAITVAAVLAVGLPLLIRSTPPSVAPAGDEPALATAPAARGALPPAKETVAEETFQPRGTRVQMSSRVGLRAFCIHSEQTARPSITGLVPASATAPPASCQVRDIMRFAYTNRSKLGFLFLVGLDDRYEVKWYEPHPPEKTSIVVEHNVVDKPLNRAVRLNVNHGEGQVRLFAIFSEKPLKAAQIKQAAGKVRADKTPLAKLQVLPIAATEQRSLLVKLAP